MGSGATAALTSARGRIDLTVSRSSATSAVRRAIRNARQRSGNASRVDERLGGRARVVPEQLGRRQVGKHTAAKRRQRVPAVVELVVGIAHVVEVHAVHGVSLHDVANDGRRVLDGAGRDRARGRGPSSSDGWLRAYRDRRPRYSGPVGSRAAKIFAERARHHQPFRVPVHDVGAGGGKIRGRRRG